MEPTTSTTRRPRRQGCEPYCTQHLHCPGCNGRRIERGNPARCRRCGAVFGQLYLGDVYAHVALHLPMEEAPAASLRYFDLTLLHSKGVERVHGWYNPATKRVAQIG